MCLTAVCYGLMAQPEARGTPLHIQHHNGPQAPCGFSWWPTQTLWLGLCGQDPDRGRSSSHHQWRATSGRPLGLLLLGKGTVIWWPQVTPWWCPHVRDIKVSTEPEHTEKLLMPQDWLTDWFIDWWVDAVDERGVLRWRTKCRRVCLHSIFII